MSLLSSLPVDFSLSLKISDLNTLVVPLYPTNLHHLHRFEQLTLQANAIREELHTEIERMLNDIIKFKVHVQKSLEDYEGFVVEEVEVELGGGDDEDAANHGAAEDDGWVQVDQASTVDAGSGLEG